MKVGLLITMLIPYLTCFFLGMIGDEETSVDSYSEKQEGSIVKFIGGQPEILVVDNPDVVDGQGESLGVVNSAINMIKGVGQTLSGIIGMMSLNYDYFYHNTFTQITRYILLIFSVAMVYNLTSEMIRLFKFWG